MNKLHNVETTDPGVSSPSSSEPRTSNLVHPDFPCSCLDDLYETSELQEFVAKLMKSGEVELIDVDYPTAVYRDKNLNCESIPALPAQIIFQHMVRGKHPRNLHKHIHLPFNFCPFCGKRFTNMADLKATDYCEPVHIIPITSDFSAPDSPSGESSELLPTPNSLLPSLTALKQLTLEIMGYAATTAYVTNTENIKLLKSEFKARIEAEEADPVHGCGAIIIHELFDAPGSMIGDYLRVWKRDKQLKQEYVDTCLNAVIGAFDVLEDLERNANSVEQDTDPAKPVAKDSDLSKVETTDPGVSASSPETGNQESTPSSVHYDQITD